MEKEQGTNILMVDDQPKNLLTIEAILSPLGKNLVKANSGEEALNWLLDHGVAVILLDVNMPGMDGFETAKIIRERDQTSHVPIIFLTAHDTDSQKTLKGYEFGAVDFIFKPIEIDEIIRSKVSFFVQLYEARQRERERELEHEQENEQRHVRELQEETLRRTAESLKLALAGTIQALSKTVEIRDPYTAGHQIRVADLARAIATGMGIPADQIEGICIAGVIHDLGKISVPTEILSKPCRLHEMEFSLVKEHPQKGYDILKGVDFGWPVAEMVYQHHERLDGSGYPQGLKGDEIALGAKIIAVADVVEAMVSHRPYRSALGLDAALEEISSKRGILYDPDVVNTCLSLFREKQYRLVDI